MICPYSDILSVFCFLHLFSFHRYPGYPRSACPIARARKIIYYLEMLGILKREGRALEQCTVDSELSQRGPKGC